MRLIVLASAALLLAQSVPPVAAQSVVGADSILQSLKPRDGALVGGATRGVKHMIAPADAAKGQAMAAAPASAAPRASLPVLFATGSAQLSPAGREQLDALGAALRDPQLAGSHFRIEGHTDTVGDDGLNLALSARRAHAVVDYLATRFGIDRKQLAAEGMGKQGLAVATPDQTAEPRNRRVVVINLDG